jgi:hypothetical protein
LSFLFKEVIKKPLSLGFIKSKRATNFTTKMPTPLSALFQDYKLPDLKQKSTAHNSHAF